MGFGPSGEFSPADETLLEALYTWVRVQVSITGSPLVSRLRCPV
jgi:hypothetical protein